MLVRALLVALLVAAAAAQDQDQQLYDLASASSTSSVAPEPTSSSSTAPEPTTSSSAAPEPSTSSSAAPVPTSSASPTPTPTPTPSPPAPAPKSHRNHTLYVPCIRIDFDVLAVTDGLGRTVNVSSVLANSTTDISGNCQFVVNPKNTSVEYHIATISATFTSGKSSVDVTFVFAENAIYSPSGDFLGGNHTVSLQSITTVTTVNTVMRTDTVTLGGNAWRVNANSSFSCDSTFNFTSKVNQTNTVVVQLGNIQAQAFLPANVNSFSHSGANSDNCPAILKLTTDKVGLIIGGIISALAVFGIISFACSKCKNGGKSGYQTLNDSV